MAAKNATRFHSLTDWMKHLKEAGAKGGKKRAANLTKKQIAEIGKKGAVARWGKKKRAKKKAAPKSKARARKKAK
jgi:general stress protein YciG